MEKIEKVIKALELCENDGCGFNCTRCHYETDTKRSCVENLMHDALELLKEQHKKGHWIGGGDPCEWACSVCRYRVARHNNTPFCPNCGADMMKGGAKNG